MSHGLDQLRSRVLTFVGAAYLVVGIALYAGDPLAKWYGGAEAQVWGTAGRYALFCTGSFFLFWGGLTLYFRRKEALANLNLLVASLLIVTPLLAEIGLRSGIAAGIEKVQRPGLYADYLSDDDYFRLRARWSPSEAGSVVGRFHPLLGWAPPPTDENPLGIIARDPYVADQKGENLLFYGDSFVAGTTPDIDNRIPQILDRMLPDTNVLNYGVGGFGLGQIYLRFKTTHGAFQNPGIIIGIMTTDLDRSVLSFRTGPKPYFTLQDEDLILNGAPMVQGSQQWEDRFTPELNSYLLAYGLRSWRILAGGGDRFELNYRRQEKIDLNRRLLAGIIEEARSSDLPILFVTFASDIHSHGDGWRERLLDEELTRHDIPHLRTRELFHSVARHEEVDPQVFMAADGHPNARGNRIVASAIAEILSPGLEPRHQADQFGEDRPGLD